MWTVVNEHTETTDDGAKFLFSAVRMSILLTPQRQLLERKSCHGRRVWIDGEPRNFTVDEEHLEHMCQARQNHGT